ncbi:hypothetical protein [Psychromicrobium xiongbiense]|uniref:hypothetical protein n=1 Tax=Psychromicrobium xiongbiense TaxID=3051184 RepID=UPI002552E73E|nr:hypothetical protein [Psychromicrobium sp. YIM S02556]
MLPFTVPQVILSQDVSPSPDVSPSLNPGLTPDQVSPGFLGFLFTFFVVAIMAVLIVDMVRRIRRVRYRAQVAGELQDSGPQFAATAVDSSAGTVSVAEDREHDGHEVAGKSGNGEGMEKFVEPEVRP